MCVPMHVYANGRGQRVTLGAFLDLHHVHLCTAFQLTVELSYEVSLATAQVSPGIPALLSTMKLEVGCLIYSVFIIVSEYPKMFLCFRCKHMTH